METHLLASATRMRAMTTHSMNLINQLLTRMGEWETQSNLIN